MAIQATREEEMTTVVMIQATREEEMTEVVIQVTRDEEMTMVVTMTPHRPLVVRVVTEILTVLRMPGTRAKRTMARSPMKSAVTEGWEQVACQQGKMMTTPETRRLNAPHHLPRDQGRSRFLRNRQQNAVGENKRPHDESSRCSYRWMHNTWACA